MSEPPKTGEAPAIFKKIVVPFEQEGPVEEIVYIDVAVVPLDEVLNRGDKQELSFLVLNRLVMGVPVLKNLQAQIASLLDRLENHETVHPSSTKRKKTKTKASSS